ncbi:MAG: hypothetical protein V4690_01945 [Patescibacteria group bacterium]
MDKPIQKYILGFGIIIIVVFGLLYFTKKDDAVGINAGWKTQTNLAQKVEFMYPESIGKTYITPTDWPPIAKVSQGKLACAETQVGVVGVGQITLARINGDNYCITKASEGAAGSTYTKYVYEKEVDDKTVGMEFTLRYPQCANYDEAAKTLCETEQGSFELDNLVDEMFETIKFID